MFLSFFIAGCMWNLRPFIFFLNLICEEREILDTKNHPHVQWITKISFLFLSSVFMGWNSSAEGNWYSFCVILTTEKFEALENHFMDNLLWHSRVCCCLNPYLLILIISYWFLNELINPKLNILPWKFIFFTLNLINCHKIISRKEQKTIPKYFLSHLIL